MKVPIGEAESETLEFKGRDSLERPERIAREVVALLNASGGNVWVGLAEEDGTARQLQPIEDPQSASDRLTDCFTDRIEPTPRTDEVRVRDVLVGAEHVLVVHVKPDETRRPYAVLDSSGRHFLRRVGRRMVRMSREELFNQQAPRQPRQKELKRRKNAVLEDSRDAFWMGLILESPLALNTQSSGLEKLLREPRLSGNRSSGWTVVNLGQYTESRMESETLAQVHEASGPFDGWRLDVNLEGSMTFRAQVDVLTHQRSKELYAHALLEYPTSFLRVASKVAEFGGASGGRVYFDLILQGVEGWSLKPGSPGSLASTESYPGWPHQPPLDDDVVAFPRPWTFDLEQLLENADACAWRVVRDLYQAFGYRESCIPSEFDRDTKRLSIGD